MNETFLVLLVSVSGAMGTYLLSVRYKYGPVLASALLSLLFAILMQIFTPAIGANLAKLLAVVFFGASFVGMCSEKVICSQNNVSVAGLFFGVIYLLTRNVFVGYGGGLGFRASLSVLCALGLLQLLQIASKKFFPSK